MRKIILIMLLFSLSINMAYCEETSEYTKYTPTEIIQLLDVAKGELGIMEEGDGTSKYGIWAKDPKAQWCAEFLCWCVSTADSLYGSELLNNVYPYYSNQNVGRDWFIKMGRYVDRKGRIHDWGSQWYKETGKRISTNSYIPKTGDFMFFSYDGTFNTSHVALVEYTSGNSTSGYIVHVIEGNNPDRVARNTYPIDKSQILGYGTYSKEIATTMRFGNKGEPVLELQKQLQALNYLTANDISGLYDNLTVKVVSDFQKSIPEKIVNGIADLETQQAINQAFIKNSYYSPNTWVVED